MNPETLTKDFHRFSTLHSWYKHLPITKEPYVFFLSTGEQERYSFDTRVTDATGQHWHFTKKEFFNNPDNKEYYKNISAYEVSFGPCLSGCFDISDNKDADWDYLRSKYPEYENDLNIMEQMDSPYGYPKCMEIAGIICKQEHDEHLRDVLDAVFPEPYAYVLK